MKHARTRRLCICCVLLCAAATAQTSRQVSPSAPAELHYTISVQNRAQHLVHVQIEVPEQFARDVQLPVWNALYQVRDFSQNVEHTAAHDRSRQPLAVTAVDKTTWRVAGEGPFTFEYDVVADNPGPFGAVLNEQHAFFNLAEICAYVVGAKDRPIAVSLTDFPPEWKAATLLVDGASKVGGTAVELHARSYDQLVDSPVELADFQETDFAEGGANYRVVVDADLSDYDMKSISGLARKIAETEVEWMGDRPFDHYVFIYHFPRRPAAGGMEHAYGTVIDASAARVKDDPLFLADVTAHEFFHLWNVKRIRPQSLEPVDYTKEQYTRALWFSEGVTSTVADYMRVRAGYLEEKAFLSEVASDIGQLEARPARLTQSVEESSLEAWLEKYPQYGSPQRSISYYNKGEILGMLLDLQMRQASGGKKSLRDLFLWMNEHYAKQGRPFPDSRGVQDAAEAVTGADFRDFFARYVAGIEAIPYDQFFATVGLRLDKQTVIMPDPGFRTLRGQSSVPVVVSVEPDSDAANAGLRPGDVIEQVNGRAPGPVPENDLLAMRIGDTVRLRVQSATGRRRVKFKLPGNPVASYALVDRDDATPAQRARRSAWMRGESVSD